MLEVIDTRDPATSAHIVQHPTKPFALVRLHQTYGGREVVSLVAGGLGGQRPAFAPRPVGAARHAVEA